MIAFRSVLFNTLFYLNLILQMIIMTPAYFLLPRKKAYGVAKNWARSNHWLFDKVVGTTFEIEGLENIPADGGYIFAPKHQSFWDAYALLPWLDDPFYILKRELTWIPLFGWYLKKQRMVPVDRSARGKVMAAVMQRTKEEMNSGRQLIIYPEGTRRPPGATPEYKYGIARLYRDLQVPVVPVVMHPGLFWPRRKFIRYPGHFKVRILPAIAPGMDPDAFLAHLVEVMETASDRLLVETVAENPNLPLPPTAEQRLAELKAHTA
ncbi:MULTISPECIES: lysophospholipid acyltransferase family protein [unclassified Shinella]|jgi:1-acyl-sn-glycerol-3-phosphate acyltransferase|uniref:lysophospholipid acyltransferase family protein n=1 Tax=unclassified Shinella TaxID=2643062 RepID=UPI00234F56AF|nr:MULTISPECIES: 1-acyl-sn-glycerol-3-phosphate acyltransferase [unclassified Shinella]MCO5152251.1 1-acyl-sn-glycerol-3-phosphate acyltransferase [Shinella sp.]MDC7263646.1 1-acyl-sn-glycerol-3-phosphate acyltransferase [Shinella sp. HY16]MDC7270541.1 1-acyl-sn-glycerol-3-phosphate acyltransferase [Shinella sp. YZ44]